MSQQHTNPFKELVEEYMALWSEPDAELRRQSIAKLWIEDGAQFTSEHVYRGYQELEERVTAAHEQFVKTEGCIFVLASQIDAHHNAAKFTWNMIPASGGDVLANGFIFWVLADDGRIQLDYHF